MKKKENIMGWEIHPISFGPLMTKLSKAGEKCISLTPPITRLLKLPLSI
jgi:hypothetical protein